MDTKTLTAGQEVAIISNFNSRFATVKKVTPSGQVVVGWTLGTEKREARFDKDGREIGTHTSRWNRDYLRADVDAVRAEIDAKKRAVHAARVLNEIKPPDARPTYGKDSMIEIVQKLEQQIALARAAVEAM